LVVHDGDFPPGNAVEERGFPDVGASDDGDSGHAGDQTAEIPDAQERREIWRLRRFCRLYPVFCGLPRVLLFVLPFRDMKRKRIATIRNP
jgi:hypothetical protein